MLLTKLEPQKKYRLKRKIYISYRYIKHYFPWVLLVLILLLLGTVIKKNYLNKPSKVKTSEVIIKKHYYRKPIINDVTKTSDNTKLEALNKQLLAEKEKNKELSSSLINQEKQLVSALNNINESYISTFKNKPTVITKETVTVSSSQADYYNKVKAALDENSANQQNKKVFTSEKENIDLKAEKAEG